MYKIQDLLQKQPTELVNIFNRLSSIFNNELVISAILIGSGARDELSYATINEKLLLRSDLEFYVVTESPKLLKNIISPQIKKLENQYKSSWPEFHIDIAYMNMKKLKKLKPWIRHFELKQNGLIIQGEDTLKMIPNVNLDNLDFKELNDIVLWRMLGLLSRIPVSWLSGDTELTDAQNITIARSLLDVTLWALPGLSVLLPSFELRVKSWKENNIQERVKKLGIVDYKTLQECLNSRRTERCSIQAEELFTEAVTTYELLLFVVHGRVDFDHKGAGLGFSSFGIVKKLRAALRVRQFGLRVMLNTIKNNPYTLVAETSHLLLIAAENILHKNEITLELIKVKKMMGWSYESGDDIQIWNKQRIKLLRYIDLLLGRYEWSRYMQDREII